MKRIGMVVVTLLFVATTPETQASQAPGHSHIWHVINCELDVVAAPALSGTATMVLTFTPTDQCGAASEVTLRVETSEGLRYLGPAPWSFPFDTTTAQTATFDIEIPPDDTSSIKVWVDCGKSAEHIDRYFVTTGEKLEVWSGSPRHYAGRKKPTPPDTDRVPTREELNAKYEMSLDLRDPADYEFVNDLLGPLPEPIKPGFYRMRITMENLLKLDKRAIKAKFLEDLPGKQPPGDSTSDHESATDTLKKQSKVGRSPQLLPDIHVWLDSVDGLMGNGKLPSNQNITFFIGFENNSGCATKGVTNGFRVYSTDGAYCVGGNLSHS